MCDYFKKPEQEMRSALGRFGITGQNQIMPMRNLSGE
jgi:ATPase subunit of ABC transporter with duplicated ATPase domains